MTPAEIAAAITEYDRGDVDRIVDQGAVRKLAAVALSASPLDPVIAALRIDRHTSPLADLVFLALRLDAPWSLPMPAYVAHRLLIQFALAQPPAGVPHE